MKTLNSNIYKVFISIRNKEENLGMCSCRGMTKDKIIERTGLSRSTVNNALKILLENEFIEEGVKQVNKKAYFITEKGMKNYFEINKKVGSK